MDMKIIGAILVIGVICAAILMITTQKPEVKEKPEITGELETPEAEIEVPTFEEEQALDLGSLISEAAGKPEVTGELGIPDAETEIPTFGEEEAIDFGPLI